MRALELLAPMIVISCPHCLAQLRVAAEAAGATRSCPLCGGTIQLRSAHKPLPAHRLRGKLTESWLDGGGAAVLLGFAFLGLVVLCCWVAITSLSPASRPAASLPTAPSAGAAVDADADVARSVPVELRCDSYGLRGRITNHSGVPLSRVAVVVRVFESGKSTPIIERVYHLEQAGGIEKGATVDCQVFWRNEDRKVYTRALAKGPLVSRAAVASLIAADGEALYVNPP